MSMQPSGAKRRVYADYAAASPVDERVLATMMPYFTEKFGNPSSLHTSGREPRKAIEEARTKVASLFNAKRKEEIVFTSGGTEAAMKSVLRWLLIIWVIAYPVISCSPLAAGDGTDAGAVVSGGAAMVTGAVLFFPWIVGVIILGILYAVAPSPKQ